eukprot:scaffold4614_cov247-Pinguiococcus_pyrenoidosus.AAC.3
MPHLRGRVSGEAPPDAPTSISYLSEAIDVYSEWIDECERVNDPGGEHDDYDEEHDRALPRSSAAVAQGRDEVEDDEEDLF